MATTSRPIDILKVGIRDTSAAVVASGNCRFYQPGTLTTQTVYSDAACTTPYSQPIVTSAAGQATVYTLEPVRMIVKNSGDTVTYYDDIVNLNRHDSIYVTSSGINGGAETTLETVLSTATTSLGSAFQYKESSGATARNYVDRLGEDHVSVVDFGATGDGTTNDTTAIQAAIDRVEARGGGIVYFPEGTYRVQTGGTSCLTVDAAGVSLRGAGRGISIIKNFTTTANCINIDLGGAADAKSFVRDLSITNDTTSSLSALLVANGSRIHILNVGTALHRTGISTSAVTAATVEACNVDSNDGNAAALGLTLGARGRAYACEISSSTDVGSGITMAADSRCFDTYVTNFATGVLMSGARAFFKGGHVTGSTTGISMTAASCHADTYVTGCTTGISVTATTCSASGKITSNTNGVTTSSAGTEFVLHGAVVSSNTTGVTLAGARGMVCNSNLTSNTTGASLEADTTAAIGCTLASNGTAGVSVGAFANCMVVNCIGGSITNLSVNASATGLVQVGNAFARAYAAYETTDAGASISWTPTPGMHGSTHSLHATNAGAKTLTTNNTATSNLMAGDRLTLLIVSSGGGTVTGSWGTQYKSFITGTSLSNISVASGSTWFGVFEWTGAVWRVMENSTLAYIP